MFDQAQTVDVVSGDEEGRARRKRRTGPRRRRIRDPRFADRYAERKLAGLCVKCGRPVVPDRQMCARHLEEAREATRRAMARRRAKLRRAGLCANGCGRLSTSYRCFVCAVRAGEAPALSIAESFGGVKSGVQPGQQTTPVAAIHRETITNEVTDSEGRTRTRFRGSGKRGAANQTAFVVDGQNLRYAKAALDKAIQGCVEAEAPEVKQLPRIQRHARRREWQAFADLARRHLDELLEDYDREDG